MLSTKADLTLCPDFAFLMLYRWAKIAIAGLALAIAAVGFINQESNAQTITSGDLQLDLQLLFNGEGSPLTTLSFPTQVLSNGDQSGDLYLPEQGNINDKGGRIRRLTPAGSLSTFLDLDPHFPDIHPLGAGALGFLGMAFHPEYNNPASPGHRKLYTFHTEGVPAVASIIDFTAPSGQPVHHHNVVTEWQADATNPNIVDVATKREVLRTEHIDVFHSGGAMDFDNNGNLLITIGTSHAFRSVAQNLDAIEGSVLRIDPIDPLLTPGSINASGATGRYRIPADNAYVGEDGIDEIYASGARNPYRASFDPVSGLFFAGDVGQNKYEEVNAISNGDNLGWPYREGDHPGLSTPPDELLETFRPPIAEYGRGDGRSVIGGFVYRGAIEELQGKYLFGEFSFGLGNFDVPPGRLFWMEPFDENGDLKPISENEVFEFTFSSNTQDLFKSTDGFFDTTLYGFGVDDNGEILIVGTAQGSNRTRLYRIGDAIELSSGDFNGDGVVDAVDYAVWREELGQEGFRLLADANNDLVVDAMDYQAWRSNYGTATGVAGDSGASGPAAVPAPGSLLLVSILAVSGYLMRSGQ